MQQESFSVQNAASRIEKTEKKEEEMIWQKLSFAAVDG